MWVVEGVAILGSLHPHRTEQRASEDINARPSSLQNEVTVEPGASTPWAPAISVSDPRLGWPRSQQVPSGLGSPHWSSDGGFQTSAVGRGLVFVAVPPPDLLPGRSRRAAAPLIAGTYITESLVSYFTGRIQAQARLSWAEPFPF